MTFVPFRVIFSFIMINIRRTFRILFLVITLTLVLPIQRVQAMDPVTLAILAPVAIQTANAAKPLVARSSREHTTHKVIATVSVCKSVKRIIRVNAEIAA